LLVSNTINIDANVNINRSINRFFFLGFEFDESFIDVEVLEDVEVPTTTATPATVEETPPIVK
jgi:CHASE1-domain containing sensor protein